MAKRRKQFLFFMKIILALTLLQKSVFIRPETRAGKSGIDKTPWLSRGKPGLTLRLYQQL